MTKEKRENLIVFRLAAFYHCNFANKTAPMAVFNITTWVKLAS